MAHAEYTRWWQFYNEEPFGSPQNNFHAALITSAIYNSSAKHKGNHKPSDFMPADGPQDSDFEEPSEQAIKDQIALFKRIG